MRREQIISVFFDVISHWYVSKYVQLKNKYKKTKMKTDGGGVTLLLAIVKNYQHFYRLEQIKIYIYMILDGVDVVEEEKEKV